MTTLEEIINDAQKSLPDANSWAGAPIYFVAYNPFKWMVFQKVQYKYETKYGIIKLWLWRFKEFQKF